MAELTKCEIRNPKLRGPRARGAPCQAVLVTGGARSESAFVGEIHFVASVAGGAEDEPESAAAGARRRGLSRR